MRVYIATQLNSTRRRVELSCVVINGPLGNARYIVITSDIADSADNSLFSTTEVKEEKMYYSSQGATFSAHVARCCIL